MQAVCLLFAGRRGLEDQQTRQAILRIPEVSRRISQAQNILERCDEFNNSFDLHSFISMNDKEFCSQKNLKSLTTAIVQIGLYDRYVKYRSQPQFLVGLTNESSALKVCANKLSFADFIMQSDYCTELQTTEPTTIHLTQLAGVNLEEYCLYDLDPNSKTYDHKELHTKDSSRIIEKLLNDNMTNQCIHIGPHYEFRLKEFETLSLQGLSSMSSIDLDPILSSFWKTA